MPPPIPRCSSGAYSSLNSPSHFSLPRYGSRVGLHIVLFEACSTFTRVAACTLALSPIRDTLIEGFSHFVTSMTAPLLPAGAIAGWDFHPLESAAFARRTPTTDIHPSPCNGPSAVRPNRTCVRCGLFCPAARLRARRGAIQGSCGGRTALSVPVHVHKPALSQAAEVGVKWRSSVDAGRATSEPLDAHGSNARSRSRRGNSLANHFFIFKAAPSKVVTMACISPSLVM